YAYKGMHVGAERLAREACEIEIVRCHKPIGKQDQYSAAYGGLQYMQFNPDETVFVDPIICEAGTKRRLQERLLMLYTGTKRSADAILGEQKAKTETEAEHNKWLSRMVQLAAELRDELSRNTDNLDFFGEILHEGWLLKQHLASGISNPCINEWYERARQHGAIGGKILGAGGGGFLLLYARPEQHDAITRALPELRSISFAFEPQGSKIIYVEEGAT
ncbi:MAG: GHMP kinase, partial [Chloroflexi bacterium]|nr:GHMP kinase [Chloroflexota bacterium]